MKNWLVQFLVDVGLVRPREEVEGSASPNPRAPNHDHPRHTRD